MNANTKCTCSHCGKVHDEWPALTFDSPTSYHVLSEAMKKEIGELSDDFCIVHHPEQTDRFIRATLTIKVNDHCDPLEYGIWVSLSEKSFNDYEETFGNNHDARYFGWLGNDIPDYEMPTGSVPTTVATRRDGLRPEIIPHQDFDHQLVRDYYEGISRAEAERRINQMLKIINERHSKSLLRKPWWKIW